MKYNDQPMGLVFLPLLGLAHFLLTGFGLFTQPVNSVEDIIVGAVLTWSLVVILMSIHSTISRIDRLKTRLGHIPQSEGLRISLAVGGSSLLLSIVRLAGGGGGGGEILSVRSFWLIVLILSAKLFIDQISRMRFQWKVRRRFESRRRRLGKKRTAIKKLNSPVN